MLNWFCSFAKLSQRLLRRQRQKMTLSRGLRLICRPTMMARRSVLPFNTMMSSVYVASYSNSD
jgi:hypothetical protein